ncbi:MAG: flavin reductase, partial [Nanoarchaeota archaeon]
MDLAFGDEKTKKFITNVGLITTNGSYGYNIMACEWTHHISYSPGLIAICLGPKCATLSNIRTSKEFGISIAAKDQNLLSSVVGNNSGKTVDKIKIAKELGYKFSKA